jgi:hypothetical protein
MHCTNITLHALLYIHTIFTEKIFSEETNATEPLGGGLMSKIPKNSKIFYMFILSFFGKEA